MNPKGKFTVERQITCGCCLGKKVYIPLFGPAELCGTCKGEGVVMEVVAESENEIVTQPNPPITVDELAKKLGKSEAWANAFRRGDALRPVNTNEYREFKNMLFGIRYGKRPAPRMPLAPELSAAIDAGEIDLRPAFWISKVKPHSQKEWVRLIKEGHITPALAIDAIGLQLQKFPGDKNEIPQHPVLVCRP